MMTRPSVRPTALSPTTGGDHNENDRKTPAAVAAIQPAQPLVIRPPPLSPRRAQAHQHPHHRRRQPPPDRAPHRYRPHRRTYAPPHRLRSPLDCPRNHTQKRRSHVDATGPTPPRRPQALSQPPSGRRPTAHRHRRHALSPCRGATPLRPAPLPGPARRQLRRPRRNLSASARTVTPVPPLRSRILPIETFVPYLISGPSLPATRRNHLRRATPPQPP